MMKAEYPESRSCPQKGSAEHGEYAEAQSVGGVRRLGIPTVVDRIIQQAIAQQAIQKVKPFQNVYLETMEEAKDRSRELDKAGSAERKDMDSSENSKGILAMCCNADCTGGSLKRNTRTVSGYHSIQTRYEQMHLCD